MDTVLIKRSIEKDGLPDPNKLLFIRAKQSVGEGLFVAQYSSYSKSFISRGTNDYDVHHEVDSIIYYLEEITLSVFIEKIMPTELKINEEFPTQIFASTNVERNKQHDNRMIKKGIEWIKNKLANYKP